MTWRAWWSMVSLGTLVMAALAVANLILHGSVFAAL